MKNLFALKAKKYADTKNAKLTTKRISVAGIYSIASLAFPIVTQASVESSLAAVQDKIVGTLLPLGAMCGLAVAGLSFVAGHPNSRQHFFYAIIGAIVGFGSESIVRLIQNIIH